MPEASMNTVRFHPSLSSDAGEDKLIYWSLGSRHLSTRLGCCLTNLLIRWALPAPFSPSRRTCGSAFSFYLEKDMSTKQDWCLRQTQLTESQNPSAEIIFILFNQQRVGALKMIQAAIFVPPLVMLLLFLCCFTNISLPIMCMSIIRRSEYEHGRHQIRSRIILPQFGIIACCLS